MKLDRKFVKRRVNKNYKYRHVSANSFDQEFYNSGNRTEGFVTKSKKRSSKETLNNKS